MSAKRQRIYLISSAMIILVLLIGACAPAATLTPEIIERTVVVETTPGVVEKTVVVEKLVTPTTAPTPTPISEPKPGGTLNIGIRTEFTDFDPYNLAWSNYPVYDQLYDTLLKYEGDLTPRPWLAESWESSTDGLTWTLHLRKGVKFHNGREFTADDVLKNFEKAMNQETGYHMYTQSQAVESVEAPDDYTVVVHLKEPDPAILDFFEGFSMIAPESFDALKDHPIGTGPYKFVEWIPNDHATLEKNEDYWGDKGPYVDRIIIHPNPDSDALVAALESGAYDIVWDLPFKDVPRLEKEGYTIWRGTPGALVWQLYVNPNKITDKRIRQAIQYALDRKTILEKAFYGQGNIMYTPFPDYSMAYDPSFDNYYPFDLDKAKALLEDAGATDLKFTINVNTLEQAAIAQILQADLAKIGVDATIQLLDYSPFYAAMFAAEYDTMTAFISNSNKDPSRLALNSHYRTVASPILCGEHPYCPEEYVNLMNQAATMTDPEARKDIYERVAEILLDESWAISLADKPAIVASQPFVRGIEFRMDTAPRFGNVWLAH
jgi:peptide/nickel transport system substrate-binding protein